jgi:hypothetical protein
MFVLSRRELQRRGQCVDDGARSAATDPLLQSRVVADADPGEFGELFPAQSRDSPTSSAGLDTRSVWRQPFAPATQKAAEVVRSFVDHEPIVAPAADFCLPQTGIPSRTSVLRAPLINGHLREQGQE